MSNVIYLPNDIKYGYVYRSLHNNGVYLGVSTPVRCRLIDIDVVDISIGGDICNDQTSRLWKGGFEEIGRYSDYIKPIIFTVYEAASYLSETGCSVGDNLFYTDKEVATDSGGNHGYQSKPIAHKAIKLHTGEVYLLGKDTPISPDSPDQKTELIKQKALSKLTEKEKVALGLV